MAPFSTRAPHAPLPVREAPALRRHAGRRFLVTGAAGGVGLATAARLTREGAKVAMADIRADLLANEARRLEGAIALPVDVGDRASVAEAVRAAESGLGGIDGLVNCAAIFVHADPLATDMTDWERLFRVNLFGAYEMCRLVAKTMMKAKLRGAIVNVASQAGKKGHAEALAYSASKAALINMTRTLSAALAPCDINVNCVCPGGVATDMLREVAIAYGQLIDSAPAEVFEKLISGQLQRHVEPDEVARTISFLLGDEAHVIRGQALNADGGDAPY